MIVITPVGEQRANISAIANRTGGTGLQETRQRKIAMPRVASHNIGSESGHI
jgi:hypothetical protein